MTVFRLKKHYLKVVFALTYLIACLPDVLAQTITITTPSTEIRVAEGRDYATYELGNRWDMHCPDWNGAPNFPGDSVWDAVFTCDLVVSRNRCVTNELFSGGTYSATSTNTCNNANNPDANLIYVSPGPVAGVGLSNGRIYPISTGTYRHFTAKVRTTNTANNQGGMVFFQTSADANDPFGRAGFKTIQPGQWQIVTFDMINDINIGGNATLTWDGQSSVIGFRFDPTPNNNIDFEIDWARLTTDASNPLAPDSSLNVEWSATGIGGGSTFSITAIDNDGAEFVLAESLGSAVRSATVDLSKLAPGAYAIEVSSNGTSDQSGFLVIVNHAPEIHITQPDKVGDESRDFADEVLGNPWGPMDAADIITDNAGQTNLQSILFDNGELLADAPDAGLNPGDPRMTFEMSETLDSDFYRMLSYEFELEGEPGQIGSVARIHWGTDPKPIPIPDTVTDDIRVRAGMNTYVLGDMHEVPDKDGFINQWQGQITNLRFDPHEVNDTRFIVFRSMRIRPFDTSTGNYLIEWDLKDENSPNDTLLLDLYFDEDRNPDNANDTLIIGNLDASNGLSNYLWNTDGLPEDVVEIRAEVSDGFNTVSRYASGPLSIIDSLIFTDGFELF